MRVLGDFRVARGGSPVDLPPSKKTRALLAYLAVTGQPHQRERLCEMFWDLPDDPRGALRWSLSKIRQIVNVGDEACLTADRNSVTLRVGGRLDYHRVGKLQRADLASRPTSDLEAAAGLFSGGFLADLALPRCPDYEAWRVAIADEVELGSLRLLQELVRRLEREPERALPYAQALHRALPDSDEIARQVLTLSEAARRTAVAFGSPQPVSQGSSPLRSERQPAERTEPEHHEARFCRTPDGVRIAYAISGSGPPIVRAAHWMSHLQYDWESPVWRHWIRGLSERNTLIRYDERCNGLSDWAVDDLSFEAMISDLESVVAATGIGRFTLLGISQSCAVSVAYAVRHPERVSGLILYGGYVKGWRKRGNPREIATREALATLMREGWGQDNALFRQLFTSLFIRNAGPQQIAWLDELQRRTVSPFNAWKLQNVFADIDVSDLLPQVAVPTLVLHAREDAVAPVESGRAFAAAIPGARFIEIDSANHILLEGEPAFPQFLDHIHSFVAETAASAQPLHHERRERVTTLAIEIVSPLAAFEDVDPEVFMHSVDPLLDLAAAEIERGGGMTLSRGQSDLTAIFEAGDPQDQVRQAARTALAITEAVETASQAAARVRAAFDTGDVIVRTGTGSDGQRPSFNGSPIRVARRLAQALSQGIIAVTSRSQAAADGSVRLEPLEPSAYPSFAHEQRVYRLVGAAPESGAGTSPDHDRSSSKRAGSS